MIADTKRFSADPEGELDRVEETFVHLHPKAREMVLTNAERAITADDGVTLRQKAQLLNVHRRLNDLDQALRWLKR